MPAIVYPETKTLAFDNIKNKIIQPNTDLMQVWNTQNISAFLEKAKPKDIKSV